jgi:hypothetical protein
MLSVEIRELDSERQSLVYNHHHELIAASDTIAAVCLSICLLGTYEISRILIVVLKVKARAESLEGDLDLLKAAFSEISRLGAEVAMEYDTPPSGS